MKKIIFFTIFVFALFVFNTQVIFAQGNTGATNSAQTTKVEYALPYPGLLPDNPLYFLKAIRDRIVGFFISDPLKKADFDLLAADKRLSAGIMLFAKGKSRDQLAQSTISKGENYFEQAISEAIQAKNQGEDNKDILARLYNSSLKHQEVIKSLEDKSSGNLKDEFKTLEQRTEKFQNQVKSLIPK